MRRRWPMVAAVTVAVCVLAGCSDRAPEAPAATSAAAAATAPAAPATSVAATAANPGTASGPDGFVAVVRARLPEVAVDRRDEEIQAIADTACADLIAGRSADDIVTATRTLGTVDAEATDHATARELVKLAIDTTCFGERDRVDEF
ncbi:hypothetical protein QLQ12_26065 [Actinoplanes sp. NEAU-A12]|uniref:DUF732 domain-containing protein n=1 Tax=Actinoplanes sandaracinus TaxID=3045177 RepID=A0ABT6WQW7_9ACTN|nr:hypothetical protein [Actinoplanes sandaracinus]MDI6102089.1 hypothetical protein [Actinoplanes sandaracinus]